MSLPVETPRQSARSAHAAGRLRADGAHSFRDARPRHTAATSRRQLFGFLLAFTSACGWQEPKQAEKEKLLIFAASSLADAFVDAKTSFEVAHENCQVVFNFGGSQELRTQIEQGAVADLFAAADETHMQRLVRQNLVSNAQVFAHNEPVLVVSGEETAVTGFADLPHASRIVIGVPEVPIGRYTRRILDNAEAEWGHDFRKRVESKVISHEFNVRQILAKLNLGEASAVFVYQSDVGALPRGMRVIPIPSRFNVTAHYFMARTRNASHSLFAAAWVDWILTGGGRKSLSTYGFRPADGSGG